jgi:hypothetical protein
MIVPLAGQGWTAPFNPEEDLLPLFKVAIVDQIFQEGSLRSGVLKPLDAQSGLRTLLLVEYSFTVLLLITSSCV